MSAALHSPDDPIVALATPAASSALAVIRVSGSGSLNILSALTAPARDLSAMQGHTIHRVGIRDGVEDVDDVLIAVYKAPRSYTGEEGAEIFCHGSLPVIKRMISLLTRSGFRQAGPGEFTQRAFLNGRMDLTRAEAVNEIVRARTDRARGLALQRLSGAVEQRIRSAREALVDLRASLEVMIDYPEEETGDAVDEVRLRTATELLSSLSRGARQGRIYQEGASVAIAGATNVGKSRLFNAMLRQDRAIVSEIHGTTRDWLEAAINLDGVPVRLYDTAGMRSSADPLEVEGMRRTEELIRAADLVVYLVDGGRGMGPDDERTLAGLSGPAPVIRVWNKADLPGLLPRPEGFLSVSAATAQGLDALEKEIVGAVLGGGPRDSSEPLISSDRQRDLLDKALAALGRFTEARSRQVPPDLLAVDLADSLDALGEMTGEVTSAEILERMFSQFCVGK